MSILDGDTRVETTESAVGVSGPDGAVMISVADKVTSAILTSPTLIEVLVAGVQGPQGIPSAGLVYEQTTPAATWIWQHNLNRRPPVVVRLSDAPTIQVFPDVEYLDANTISIEFPAPCSGNAEI